MQTPPPETVVIYCQGVAAIARRSQRDGRIFYCTHCGQRCAVAW